MILIMTNETADNDIFELHAVIHEAFDDANAESWIKWSYVSKQQKCMRDKSADINHYIKNDVLT